MAKLFVFGLLKQGDRSRSPLERYGITPRGAPLPAVVYGYTLMQWQGAQYPIAVPAPRDHIGPKLVQGEVITVWDDDHTWRRLDAYEGALSGRFTREQVMFHAEGKQTGTAWMYVVTREALQSHPYVEIGSYFSQLAHA